MSGSDYIIRPEALSDYRAAEELTREAFWNVYRPGCTEHYVLHCFREDVYKRQLITCLSC